MPEVADKLPAQVSRDLLFARRTLNVEERTVEVVFSTSDPIEDWPGEYTSLSHDASAVDLRRLLDTGPVLFNHNRNEPVGIVADASISGDKGIATLRFSKSEAGERVLREIEDGMLRCVSVGLRIKAYAFDCEENNETFYLATQWEPYEISVVTVPADTGARIRRDSQPDAKAGATVAVERSTQSKPDTNQMSEKNQKTPGSAENEQPPKIETVRESKPVDFTAERQRMVAITREATAFENKTGKAIPSKEIDAAIERGDSPEQFIASAFTRHMGDREAQPILRDLPEADKKRYSLVRALRLQSENKAVDGLEGELSKEVAKQTKRSARGFFVPNAIAEHKNQGVSRALEAETATAGGYTVGTELQTGSMIELLRNRMVTSRLGIRTLSGLTGNVAIPKVTGGATAYWTAEDGANTNSQQTFGQVMLSPKRLGAVTAFTKQLLSQSSIDVEAFVRQDLMAELALEKDRAIFHGTGSSGQPLGIFNLDGVKNVTFGGAPTFAKVVSFETEIATANADAGAMHYVTTPSVRGALKTTSVVGTEAVFLWSGAQVNGYPAHVTNQIADNKVVFGDFSNVMDGNWDGIDIVVDPYSLKKQGQIEINIAMLTDIQFRHPEGLCISTDAGNQ